MKPIVIILLVFIGIIILSSAAFGLEWAGLKWKGFFAPKHAAVEREVFKQTRSYNEGKVQELSKLRYEYNKEKDSVSRKAILSRVRQAFAEYDETLIDSPSLRIWLEGVKSGSISE